MSPPRGRRRGHRGGTWRESGLVSVTDAAGGRKFRGPARGLPSEPVKAAALGLVVIEDLVAAGSGDEVRDPLVVWRHSGPSGKATSSFGFGYMLITLQR